MSYRFNDHKVVNGNTLRLGLNGFRPNNSAVAKVENGELVVTVDFNGKQYCFVSNKGDFPADGLCGNPEENKDYIDVPTNVSNLKTFL